jgi:hypothetical protein
MYVHWFTLIIRLSYPKLATCLVSQIKTVKANGVFVIHITESDACRMQHNYGYFLLRVCCEGFCGIFEAFVVPT